MQITYSAKLKAGADRMAAEPSVSRGEISKMLSKADAAFHGQSSFSKLK